MFGPVHAFACESGDGGALLRFDPARDSGPLTHEEAAAMPVLREAHVALLREDLRLRVRRRMCIALRDALPLHARSLGEAALADFVEQSMHQAERCGFRLVGEILDFSGLRLQSRLLFDTHPLIQRIIEDPRLRPPDRLTAVRRILATAGPIPSTAE
jgi:hypothetical protein